MLQRNVGKTAGHIRATGENNTFNLRPDRCQRGADIVAAVEKSGAPGVGDRLTRRRDECREPPRTRISAGVRRADQHHGTAGARRGGQRRDRLSECVDDNSADSVTVSLPLLQLRYPFAECPQAIDMRAF
jgi:hypothetical protein